jgi:hypothetical protein
MSEPIQSQDARVNQSTKLILDIMEKLSVEQILKARETMIHTHNEQLALIDDVLRRRERDITAASSSNQSV